MTRTYKSNSFPRCFGLDTLLLRIYINLTEERVLINNLYSLYMDLNFY